MPAFAIADDLPCVECDKIYLYCLTSRCEKMKLKMKLPKCPLCGGEIAVRDSGKSGYVKACKNKKCNWSEEVNR